MQGGKGFLIWAMGFVAILLSAFVYNVSVGVLIITVVIFALIKPIIDFVKSKKESDSFLRRTLWSVDAIPEIIERTESELSDTLSFAKKAVSRAWVQCNTEVELIENELKDMITIQDL